MVIAKIFIILFLGSLLHSIHHALSNCMGQCASFSPITHSMSDQQRFCSCPTQLNSICIYSFVQFNNLPWVSFEIILWCPRTRWTLNFESLDGYVHIIVASEFPARLEPGRKEVVRGRPRSNIWLCVKMSDNFLDILDFFVLGV